MKRSGSTVSVKVIDNRFRIEEVMTRFRPQTVFFLYDATLPRVDFHGPFWSERAAALHIQAVR